MKKYSTLDLASQGFFSTESLRALVASSDREKPLFLVEMHRFGSTELDWFCSASPEVYSVPCIVVESKYPLLDNYKIELKPMELGFCNQSYYQCDFAALLRSGRFQAIDQAAPVIDVPAFVPGAAGGMMQMVSRLRSAWARRPSLASLQSFAARRFKELFGRPESLKF